MKKHFLFLSALALFLSSCEIFSSLSEKTGAISIKMPEGSERIAETYDVNEITSFTAELYDSGSSPVAKVSSAPGKSITFESLTPGSYAIVIKAFISEECAGYAEKSGIVVEAGATTYETITLFKNIIKNIESVEIAKESLDKITKNYTVGQTFALPEAVSITARFTSGYEKELEPDDYEIYICNAEQFAESSLVKDLTLSAKARFAAVGICTESGHKKYSEPVSLVMNAEEPVVTWTIPVVKDNEISFKISASASGEISYIWEKAKTADMAGKTACTSEINMAEDGTVALPLKDESGAYVYYVCTVTNTNSAVNGTTTASRQTAVFSSQMENFTVTFNLNYDGSTNTTQDVASGSAVEKPQPPTRDGYIFGGWYTDTDCTNEYDFAIGVTADIILYAKWTAEVITYTVTFNLNYDGSTDTTQSVTSGNAVSTPEVPTRDGYAFVGWYTDTDCTNEYDFLTGVTGNITLYAKWTVEVITTWEALSNKLNGVRTDVGDIYVSGSFNVDSAINFSGTVNIIPTGSVTFTRSADCKIFDIASGATLTFAGTDSAPIVFDGNSISSKNPMIYSSGTLTLENCTLQNAVNSSTGSCGAVESSGTTNITNCTFTSNTGSYGGAVQIYSGTVNISSITCSRNSATSGNDIYNHNGTLNIGGTVSSIDIYMNNSWDAYSPVLVPVKGITLANETYPINIAMASCSEGTAVLTQSDGMSNEEFAAAINCFTLTNEGFVIGSYGKAETEPTEPTGTTVSSFSELTTCLTSYSDSKATANIVISKDIEITGTVTIYCNVNINADAVGRTLSRGASFTDALFQIGTDVTGVTVNVGESGGTLTIDGNGNTVTASRSLINAGSSGNTVKISKKAILQNNVTSGTHGAAIYAKDSTVIIEGGTVQNNDCSAKSKSYGGAIYATNFEMSSGYLYGNKSVDAGGVYVLGSANITGGTISNNTASNYGGGIYLVGVTNSSISGVTFESNTGTTRGGAIYIAGTSTVDITDCTFTNNVSNNGKAVAFELTGGTTSIGGKINITNDNIVIYNRDGILNISKSLEITNPIPLTIFTVTSGHQYITASEGITLSNEISKFSLQNKGYTLTKTGVVQ